MMEPEPRRNTEEEWRAGEQRLAALDGWAEEVGDLRRGNMEPELLAMLTEEEQDAYAFACAAPNSYFGSTARLAWAQSLAEVRRELSTWTQEFSRVLDDGRPYVQDALEAGKELQDAQAEARMARQDAERAEAQVERLREALTRLYGYCKRYGFSNDYTNAAEAALAASEEK